MITFQAGQLSNSIRQLEQDQFTGTANLTTTEEGGESLSKILFFWKGTLTFAGDRLPTPLEFMEFLKDSLKLTFLDSALSVVETRVKNKNSIRELVDFLQRFGLVKWENIESIMEQQLLVTLEYFLTCPGTLQAENGSGFDLSYGYDGHGFSWEALQSGLERRQQKWQSLEPLSPDSIPTQPDRKGNLPEKVKPHLETWVNGQRSLLKIATEINTDPLELAEIYTQWMQQGWIKLPGMSTERTETPQQETPTHRPVILSVDDSPIVQISIQRAISDRYEVLCAKNAVEALGLLNTRKVELLLLDVTMPDIDGLEFCRTIRNISKFKDLPVIMLTAKDGFMDKMKGQFAGSTHYLTKPVDREKLLPVLEKYISVKETVA
jgi:CheY-like chemotaxis protein